LTIDYSVKKSSLESIQLGRLHVKNLSHEYTNLAHLTDSLTIINKLYMIVKHRACPLGTQKIRVFVGNKKTAFG